MDKVSNTNLRGIRTRDTIREREGPRRLQNTPGVMSRIDVKVSANRPVSGKGSSRKDLTTHKGFRQRRREKHMVNDRASVRVISTTRDHFLRIGRLVAAPYKLMQSKRVLKRGIEITSQNCTTRERERERDRTQATRRDNLSSLL